MCVHPGDPIVMNEPVRLYLIRIIDGLEALEDEDGC
jgi:hypothetical protein